MFYPFVVVSLLQPERCSILPAFPCTVTFFYKDKEERKRTILKAISSSFWCVFQQCWSVPAALAAGLLLTSWAWMEEGEGRDRRGGCDFSVFVFFTDLTVHSGLVYSFIFHWCTVIQQNKPLEVKGSRGKKGAVWPGLSLGPETT